MSICPPPPPPLHPRRTPLTPPCRVCRPESARSSTCGATDRHVCPPISRLLQAIGGHAALRHNKARLFSSHPAKATTLYSDRHSNKKYYSVFHYLALPLSRGSAEEADRRTGPAALCQPFSSPASTAKPPGAPSPLFSCHHPALRRCSDVTATPTGTTRPPRGRAGTTGQEANFSEATGRGAAR